MRLVPVDRRIKPRVVVGERIGHDMRGRIGDAVEFRRGPFFGSTIGSPVV
jgi:hypothetical protein